MTNLLKILDDLLVTFSGTLDASQTTATLAAGSSGLLDGASATAPIVLNLFSYSSYAHPVLDPNFERVSVTSASGTLIAAMTRGVFGTTGKTHSGTVRGAGVIPSAWLHEIQMRTSTVYAGDPNGNVDGYPGRLCYDTTNGNQYVKTSALGTLTGWV
jgi:hypothetical protein